MHGQQNSKGVSCFKLWRQSDISEECKILIANDKLLRIGKEMLLLAAATAFKREGYLRKYRVSNARQLKMGGFEVGNRYWSRKLTLNFKNLPKMIYLRGGGAHGQTDCYRQHQEHKLKVKTGRGIHFCGSGEIHSVPLPTKPGSSLIIPKPMKILQWDLNRSTFVVSHFSHNEVSPLHISLQYPH